ncbi:hypothetical protein [Streptomyces sp. Je 1-332]|uniref:hypothetical protein n=1 Tax=Streptomyces sp. Je 1-332 TaxID=3231270 RepID=UPI0034579849
MWPGQQPPGGEQNPQDQNPNPYQQPGYQQPNPYQQTDAQQQGQWGNAPAMPGAPQPQGGGNGSRTKVIALVAAAAVVVAAGVTGFLVLGGGDDEKNAAAPQKSTAGNPGPADSPTEGEGDDRGTDNGPAPTVKGWQVVVNPKRGTAFDVPPGWEIKAAKSSVTFEDVETGEPLITMSAPAYYKSKWCSSDSDNDGQDEDKALSATGTKGANGAKNTDEVAVNQVGWWVYGPYTQPDKKSLHVDEKAKPYTTKSGIKGSIAWARSKNAPQRSKCDSDGKAITFGFKNSEGEYVAWSLYSAKGVKDEVPDETIMKILSTVRLNGDPSAS